MLKNLLRFHISSMGLLLLFVGNLTMQNAYTTTNESCTIESNLSFSSTDSDGTSNQSNIFDGNLTTYWTPPSNTSNIEVDLGKTERICFVDIGWGIGKESNQFQIFASSDPQTQFRNIYTGNSSLDNLELERYDFQDVSARYLKVTFLSNDKVFPTVTEMNVYVYKPTSRSSRLPEFPVSPMFDNFDNKTHSDSKWKVDYTGHGFARIISEKGFGSFYRVSPTTSTSMMKHM